MTAMRTSNAIPLPLFQNACKPAAIRPIHHKYMLLHNIGFPYAFINSSTSIGCLTSADFWQAMVTANVRTASA